ncbi:MAG: HD domain-containing protein [Lachnospiraceae bacterium]|nr:HD domain-containing protein [Lachnospiraceae bacterium]
MFFSNGGSDGGTSVWLLLGTIYISMILEGKLKIVMLLLNMLVIVATWIVGYLFPDLVTEYSRGGNYFDSVAALFIVGAIIFVLISFQNNLFRKEEAKKNQQRLFEQTAMALVNAIDAKDRYTHGHSSRVADYSRKIAEYSGKGPEECNEIYYAALLHDVGKIGIPEHIINKEGKLTEEEYAVIKQHPVLGEQILHSISEFPALGIGALYHHERYDGKG